MEVKSRFYMSHNPPFWHRVYSCDVTGIHSEGHSGSIFGGFSHEKERKQINSFTSGNVAGWNTWQASRVSLSGMDFLPKNLHVTFRDLKYLTARVELKEISRQVLKGLENIEYLNIGNNKLTSLPDDLFADMKNLSYVYFDNNQIERMSSKVLSPIEHTLKRADFRNNATINDHFSTDTEGKNDLQTFIRAIDSCCLSQADRAFVEFCSFKKSGDFSDFTITVRGKEFKIHKCIFAAQSSVFI